MGRRVLAVLLVSVATLFAAPKTVAAQTQLAQPAPTEGVGVPDRSVTTQSDALSAEVNPAGLGFMNSAELRYGFDLSNTDDEILDQHALFAGAGSDWIGAGIGLQWLDRPGVGFQSSPYQKYTLAGALRPLGAWSLGLGAHFFGSATSQRLNRLTSIDIGTQWRPARYLGFGLALRETNHPFFRTDRALPLRIEPGVALRFLDGRLVVDGQFEWIPAEHAAMASPRVSLEPIDGLRAYSRVALPLDDNFRDLPGASTRVTAGIELSMGHVGLASAASFHTNSNASETLAGHAQQLWLSPSSRRSLVRPAGRWIQVDLTGNIAERATDGPFTANKRSFLRLLLKVRAMARDRSVEGVVFKVSDSGLGFGQAWELRQQIAHLRDAGKTTVSYLTQPSFLETYLASASDEVLLLPSEAYDPAGLRVTTEYYAEALSRLGIQVEFVRIGEYKSAPSSYVRRSPSKPELEQTNAYVDAVYDEIVGSIAGDRDLENAEVERAIDDVPLYPTSAIDRGFADGVVYPDELRSYLEDEHGATQLIDSGYDPSPGPSHGWEGRPEVAVVYIDGNIVRGESTETPLIGGSLTGSETISRTLEDLRRDPSVRAVVIRVDSPGGSAVASDLIYRAIRQLAEEKPVVTSMGNIAASGGYYTAAGADRIYATPTTLTGSIGIFAGKFSVGTLASWLGVDRHVIQRGKRNGRFDLFQNWTDPQRRAISKSIRYLYNLFLEQAAATRPLSPSELDNYARGRIWAGEAAADNDLVDEVGSIIDAVHAAEKLAGLQPGTARYESYPTPSPFIDLPFGGGVEARLANWLKKRQTRGSTSDSVLRTLLGRVERSVRLPLVYAQEEPLMLPPKAIVIEEQ